MSHGHQQVPDHPADGDVFTCSCGVAFRYVVLDDGYGEWMSTGTD